MKILLINATYGYTSTGLIVKDIAEMLDKGGNEGLVAYQTALNAPEEFCKVGGFLSYKLHALLCRVFGKQGYYSKCATRKFIKYIKRIKPDVVHLHNLHSNFVHLDMLLEFFAKENIPTVVTLHDCWYFTGKCFHYADINCKKFMSDCKNCPQRKAPPKSLIFDCASSVLKDRYKYFSAIPRLIIVGSSKWVQGELKKSVLKNVDSDYAYNGADISIFRPQDESKLRNQLKLSNDCRIIMGMAGKWLLKENENVLKRVVESLDNNSKLLLVGCSDVQIENLKQYGDKVIPVGFIKDRHQLAEYYSLASVFVNVTHADTLPTVNIESICCGTPVITYDSCGSPELVLPGCGKVVKENDVDGLIDAINNCKEKISDKDLTFAREQFDKENCYKKYLEIYERVIHKD
ncbi:MAG: glycosyltransferase [Clostridia bacterium]|nr:glycosyltransferase [Clostridia bacterium]